MRKGLFILVFIAGVISCRPLFSSGFALFEQSVSSMGTAYAGAAAIGEDASTIFFNPAAMTRICGTEVVVGVHGVFPWAKFTNTGSIINPVIAATAGVSDVLTGGNGGNLGVPAPVGNFYVSKNLNDRIFVGLGINAPFGLMTSYEPGWVGRYFALKSELVTVNINPSIAIKINPCLSIGAGFDVMFLRTKLTNAVDYGSIAWAATAALPAIPQAITRAFLTGTGFLPQTQDGKATLRGDSWGYGANIGLLWEPSCRTRFGVHFRSEIKQNIKGSEAFSHLPGFIANPASTGPFAPFFAGLQAASATNTALASGVKLPASVSLSGYHDIDCCWAIVGDITWTKWDVLRALVINFTNPAQPTQVVTTKWENTFRFALGTIYQPNCRLKFRMGIAYDQTPVHGKQFVTPRIPDADRFWTTCGIGYQWKECVHFDLAYAHLFGKTPKIDKTNFALPEDLFRGGLKGFWRHPHVDIISLQAVWLF